MQKVKVWDSRIKSYRYIKKEITQTKWFKNATHLQPEEEETKIEYVRKDGQDVDKQPAEEENNEGQEEQPAEEETTEQPKEEEEEEEEGHWLDGLKKQEALQLLEDEGIKEGSDARKSKKDLINKLKEHYGG